MNKWFKLGLCAIAAALVWFVAKEQWGWFNDFSAVLVVVVACLCIWGFDKINWDVFRREREVLSREDWVKRAVPALKRNCPESFRGGERFEGEIIQSVPVGILLVFVPGLDHKKCAFGEVWVDSVNYIISPLETIEWHLRTNFCKSKREVGELYLRGVGEKPALFKQETKQEVLVT